MQKRFIIFTCEHAINAIPSQYKHLFNKKEKILKTHSGFDHGTKEFGRAFGEFYGAPVVYGKFSRLMVDLNRSHGHRTTFSEMTRGLSKQERNEILTQYHHPHWKEIKFLISLSIKGSRL